MKRKALTILFLLIAGAAFTQSVDPATMTSLEDLSRSFLELVYAGSYQEAFDLVRSSPVAIAAEQLDALQATAAEQLEAVQEVYGAKLGLSTVGRRAVSDFLVQYVYVIRYEWHFVSWQIIFYRGVGDRWLFSSISYDDKVEGLLELDM
jgi:hypothetical protein